MLPQRSSSGSPEGSGLLAGSWSTVSPAAQERNGCEVVVGIGGLSIAKFSVRGCLFAVYICVQQCAI